MYFIAIVLPGELCIMPLASWNPLVFLPGTIFLEVRWGKFIHYFQMEINKTVNVKSQIPMENLALMKQNPSKKGLITSQEAS